MAIIKEKLIRRAYVWFDEEIAEKVDVKYCFYRSNPPQKKHYEEFYTLVLNLIEDENALWKNLHKNNKYEVKRACERDNLVCQFWKPNKIDCHTLNEFYEFYNEFALERGLMKLSRYQLNLLVDKELLALSCVTSEKGDSLVWHGYYHNHKIASLFYSASTIDKQKGSSSFLSRANRYLHWQDILTFKQLGIPIYDFGGWYAGRSDNKLLSINQFKEGFGGHLVKTYNFNEAVTLRGKVFLAGLSFYQGIINLKNAKFQKS